MVLVTGSCWAGDLTRIEGAGRHEPDQLRDIFAVVAVAALYRETALLERPHGEGIAWGGNTPMIPTVRACLRHRLRGPLQRSTTFMPQDSLRISHSHAETSSLSPWRDAAL